MNISNYIVSARRTILCWVKEETIHLSTPDSYFDVLSWYLFFSLMKGRIDFDKTARSCSYTELKQADFPNNFICLYYGPPPKYFLDSFTIETPNYSFQVHESYDNLWYVYPKTPQCFSLISHWDCPFPVRLTADSFARFLAEFDTLAPEIRTEAENLRFLINSGKDCDTIIRTAVSTLIDSNLKQVVKKIKVRYLNDDVILKIPLSGHTRLRIRIPISDIGSRIAEIPKLLGNLDEGFRKYGIDFRLEWFRH